MIDFKATGRESQILKIINQSVKPTVIAICQPNSFGKIWLGKLLKEIQQEYKKQLDIHTFFMDNQSKVTIYFVKGKEVKTELIGSVSKKIFKAKLSSFIKSN